MAVISINMLLICFRYLLTEIGARDLGDPHRFNMLEVRHDILISLARSIGFKEKIIYIVDIVQELYALLIRTGYC